MSKIGCFYHTNIRPHTDFFGVNGHVRTLHVTINGHWRGLEGRKADRSSRGHSRRRTIAKLGHAQRAKALFGTDCTPHSC